MELYGLKTCDTCRKAAKALGPDANFIDIRDTPLSDTLRATAFDQFGLALLNTRSTTWRNLDDAARALDPMDLLRAYPALMKRPLIVSDDQMTLGWTKEAQAVWL